MNVVWFFLKMGLFRYDRRELLAEARSVLLERLACINEDQMQEMEQISQISYGSAKLLIAFLTGKYMGSLFRSVLYVLLTALPSLLIAGALLYALDLYVDSGYLELAAIGCMPVLAALFAVKGIEYIKRSYQKLALFPWMMTAVIGVAALAVLELPIAVALGGILVLLFCFFKGGQRHD